MFKQQMKCKRRGNERKLMNNLCQTQTRLELVSVFKGCSTRFRQPSSKVTPSDSMAKERRALINLVPDLNNPSKCQGQNSYINIDFDYNRHKYMSPQSYLFLKKGKWENFDDRNLHFWYTCTFPRNVLMLYLRHDTHTKFVFPSNVLVTQ